MPSARLEASYRRRFVDLCRSWLLPRHKCVGASPAFAAEVPVIPSQCERLRVSV